MARVTGKSLREEFALLIHPDTDKQRAVWVVLDHQKPGTLEKARTTYGEAPMAWLSTTTGKKVPV